MDLRALAGNGPLKRQLEGEQAHRGLSHAYILAGPAGSGKRTLADLLSAALVCSGGGEAPCGVCPSCKKALAGIHPDVITVEPQGRELVVAQIRDLRSDAYIRPNEAERKVYRIYQAQTMNDSAQNALLKLLEEGPAYAAFLLLADNAAALLPTIRSRCQTLTLSPVSPAEAEAWLAQRYPQRTEAERRAAAEHCEGLLGRAVAELEGDAGALAREAQAAEALLEALCARREASLMELCVRLEREKWDREALAGLLDELSLLLRDGLAAAYGTVGEPDPRRRALAERAASALTPRQLMAAEDLIRRLRRALDFNLGVGHLLGWLAAGLSARQGGGRP